MTESTELFNVVQFFRDGIAEYVRRGVNAEQAVDAAKHYTSSVAAQVGLVNRVMITDMLDRCVFEWKDGEIIFGLPGQEAPKENEND